MSAIERASGHYPSNPLVQPAKRASGDVPQTRGALRDEGRVRHDANDVSGPGRVHDEALADVHPDVTGGGQGAGRAGDHDEVARGEGRGVAVCRPASAGSRRGRWELRLVATTAGSGRSSRRRRARCRPRGRAPSWARATKVTAVCASGEVPGGRVKPTGRPCVPAPPGLRVSAGAPPQSVVEVSRLTVERIEAALAAWRW